ncbi:hypothetical protein D9619_008214 [Psilocybe cf. subviscida]|uniref:Uncharacterized protein n=1 Tax=Psilocybe cf. subviscida TaxID=2480587 RepID=A0A8H5ESK6_9AGAR|nr:hypothetical protein D9619_008214 [Psilocybe cf. subviscida]
MAEYKGFTPNARDWLKPGEQTGQPFPPGYEELEACDIGGLQTGIVTNKRRAADQGQAFAAYWDSPDVSTLDAAINHFRKAGARRQREARALAFGFFLDALDRYESCGHKQADLERTIRTGNDARNLWSDGTNPGVYGLIVYSLAATHFHLYDRSTADDGLGGSSDLGAFELAEKYFLEVMANQHVGDLRLLSRIQLGVLIMTRCTHENTTSGLEMCIEHWECALKELNSPKTSTRTPSTKETESTSDNLIAEDRAIQRAGITYQLGFVYQLQYRGDLDCDSRLHNLNTTIDYFERAKRLFDDMGNPAFSSPSMFALATRLVLRWELTKEQSDMDRAKELLKTAQTVENVDEELKEKITRVLTALESEVDHDNH